MVEFQHSNSFLEYRGGTPCDVTLYSLTLYITRGLTPPCWRAPLAHVLCRRDTQPQAVSNRSLLHAGC